MAGTSASGPEGVYLIADLEERLVKGLIETADEVAHVECFDDEQRSEVYTILQAMRNDSETQELLEQQKQAADGYAGLAERLSDPALRQEVEQLRREKQRHVLLTERLLELVD